MLPTVIHREDVKAELRKRHGTVGAFARARGLKPQAVADWLRGRTSAPVAVAVAAELGVSGNHDEIGQSIKLDDSPAKQASHRLNAEVR